MKRVNIFLTLFFVVINVCRGSEPVQICQIDPALHTNICMAVRIIKSQHQRGHDLLMTFSVRFYQGTGWAAFGVGDRMERALMFALWPGTHEGGESPNLPIAPKECALIYRRHCTVVALDDWAPPSTSTKEPETSSSPQHRN
jgi:hypothetical protein